MLIDCFNQHSNYLWAAVAGVTNRDREVLRLPEVRLHRFVSMQMLPGGVIDLATDLPPDDIILLAPTASLVAQENLHPALVDLLLQAADEVYGGGSRFSMPGEFPSPQYVDFPLSPDA